MSTAEFKGRGAELHLLDELWAALPATLMILYGRRRVGKTRLLTHWMKQTGQRALYWVAEPTSALDQLRSFSQALYNFANQDSAPDDFTYANWPQAWQQVARLAQTERLALFVDEFTYLLEAEPGIAGIIQNAWDHSLKQANLFLVLSGSHLGMMQRQVLAYQAPLYGRATAHLRLQPLPFGITQSFFPKYDAAERVAIYAIFGGIPAYWERLNPKATLSENIRRQLLTANNLMQEEPRLLLQDFVADPNNYVAILRAVAHGAREQKEIAGRTGLPQGHVSKYLSVLREAGFVERRAPVTADESSRLGRYHITDPYLRFYYRFLATRQAQLALGVQEQALAEIKKHLLDYIGTYTWEELCREWLLRAAALGDLPFAPDQVGSAWTRKTQVDVVGIDTMDKTLILGECKWSTKSMESDVLQELVAKAPDIVPRKGKWTVYYLGFARGGWRENAKTFAKSLARSQEPGANWQVAGMRLLDLASVDADLVRWTT
jgi:AAA+ ATPase superfamily predicted ATPase